MAERRSRPLGPVLHTGGPQGIVSFYEGQTLEHEQSGAQVIVLRAWDGGQKALLFPLDGLTGRHSKRTLPGPWAGTMPN